jgi:hypothetical protein
MKNKIEDLRNHLFETIEMLKDGDERMDLAKAKVISEVAQTIINSAKAETDYLKITDQRQGTGFITLNNPIEASSKKIGIVK